MQNWRSYKNYRRKRNADNSYTYIIQVDGQDIVVSEAIYTEYAKAACKMEYMECGLKRDRVKKDANSKPVWDARGCPVMLPELEVSLCKLIDDDWDFASPIPTPEDAMFVSEDTDIAKLSRCIALLTESEQAMINALFFEGVTEQKYAVKLGIKQQSVNERKRRILAKIKSLWGQPC